MFEFDNSLHDLTRKNNKLKSMNGNIVVIIKSKDEELSINCSNNTTVLKDTDWFKKFRQKPNNW